MCARPSTSPSTSAARWCWAFPTTCRRSSTWRTSPTRPRRCISPRSGACSPIRSSWPRPSSGWPRRSGRSSSAAAACCGPARAMRWSSSPIAAGALALQHAAGARAVPRPSVRARHHRQLLHVAGQRDVRVRRPRARGRHQPVLLRRRRALLGKGRQDPVGRCAARLARRAEGRRHLCPIGCARRRRGDPRRPRQEARRRQTDSGGDPHERARPSHRHRAARTRCRSTSSLGCSIHAR